MAIKKNMSKNLGECPKEMQIQMISDFQKNCPNKRKLKDSNVHEKETPQQTSMKYFLPAPRRCCVNGGSYMHKSLPNNGFLCTVLLGNHAYGYFCLLAVKKTAQHIIQQVKINKYMAQTMKIQARPGE